MLAALILAAAQATSLSANNYAIDEAMPAHPARLAWSDEFNGKALDRSKWSFDTSRNKQGWYNGELQYYAANRSENLRIENGVLVIEARKDPQALRSLLRLGGSAVQLGQDH